VHTYDPLHMVWIAKPNYGVEYAWFQFFSRIYMVHKRDPLISCLSYVSRLDWLNVVEVVKQQCNVVAISLIQKLERCFLAQDIMNSTNVTTLALGL
jgi:hypothetical protein